MTRRRGERGLALVVALWVIAALSLIAAAMLGSALTTARIGHNAWIELQAQTAADAGIQSAILSLFDPHFDRRPPLDGRARDVHINGAIVSVAIQDETGRIDLNFADRPLLRDYFKAAGAPDPDALADHVIDWRTPKQTRSLNGATAEDYATAGYSYKPRGRAFESVDEVALVIGMTPDLYRRIAPGLTVYSHMNSFDTNVAPKEVLAVIPGMHPDLIADALASRPSTAAWSGHAFAVTATATQSGAQAVRKAVVLLTGDPHRPYWILDWR